MHSLTPWVLRGQLETLQLLSPIQDLDEGVRAPLDFVSGAIIVGKVNINLGSRGPATLRGFIPVIVMKQLSFFVRFCCVLLKRLSREFLDT